MGQRLAASRGHCARALSAFFDDNTRSLGVPFVQIEAIPRERAHSRRKFPLALRNNPVWRLPLMRRRRCRT